MHPIHQGLSALRSGSQLTASLMPNGAIQLLNSEGMAVARLSAKARDEWKDRINKVCRITVTAIIERRIEDLDEEFAGSCRCKKWEVPVVEMVWNG